MIAVVSVSYRHINHNKFNMNMFSGENAHEEAKEWFIDECIDNILIDSAELIYNEDETEIKGYKNPDEIKTEMLKMSLEEMVESFNVENEFEIIVASDEFNVAPSEKEDIQEVVDGVANLDV